MADQVVRVNPQMLQSILWHCRRAQPIGMIARTIPAMRRKGNPFHLGDGVFDVVRIRQLTGFVCFDYARTVNSQRRREHRDDDFESQGRRWGHRVHAGGLGPHDERGEFIPRRRTPLVRHGSRWYLDVKRQTVIKTEHRTISGNELIRHDELRPFLKSDGLDAARRRQEIDRPVIVRDYMLQNIAQLTLDRTLYLMDPCPNTSLPCSSPS